MPTKYSPTTVLGYIRLAFTLPLLGFVLWKLFSDPGFDAIKTGIQVTAVWGIINGVLGTVTGHFTADADPTTTPKTPIIPGGAQVAAVVVLLCLILPVAACKNDSPAVVSQTSAAYATTADTGVKLAIAALPASLKADLAKIVADDLTGAANLNTVANGIESLAIKGETIPSPASLQNGVLPWVEMLPDVGPLAAKIFPKYALAYPTLAPGADTLTAIGEFLRSLEPAKTVTAATAP